MEKLPAKILIVSVLVIVGAVAVFALRSPRTVAPDLPILAVEESATPSPKLPSLTSITSPNGKMILKVREEAAQGGVQKTFSVLTQDSGGTLEIYSKFVPEGDSLTVPYNTFSPDNKYLFLAENEAGRVNYYVFSTSGKNMEEGQKFIEISAPFNTQYPDLKISEVTGWGGINLLVINTDKVGGGEGPSFWFEIPSYSFIRLSSRFD